MPLTVTPNPLPAGGTAHVGYSNPARPNETITVTITNGGTGLESVQITTNDQGEGNTTWSVNASWSVAVFNAPGVDQVERTIVEG